MSRVHCIWMVIWLMNIELCNSSGKLSIHFVRFQNNKRVKNDGCCDNLWSCSEACDIFLEICATEVAQGNCNADKFRTKVFGKGPKFTFPGDLGNGRKNPLEYIFQRWQGFSLAIEIWDYDRGFLKGSSDFVDNVHVDINDAPDQNSTSASNKAKRMASKSSPTKRYIDIEIRIYCDDNYLLPDCARQCISRDDAQGHYTCDYVRGLVVCNQHWYGDNCTQYCRPRNDSLGHYTCDNFGTKICASNWFGPNCSTFCQNTDDLTGHYNCDSLTGNKVCLTNWHGEDCLVFCIAQDSSDGHYSCNKTSGGKVCLQDWYGARCKKYCLTQNDRLLGHFKCDVNGDRICLPGWHGVNCTQAMSALITCYNKLELWVDGVWYGPDNGQWQIAWSLQISTNTTLIAVKAVQYGTKGGILGSLSGGLVTDEGWKCTNRFHSNWMTMIYDDSAWSRAKTYGYNNGVNSWRKVAGIADNANWIWTADNKNDDVVYCRRLLAEILPTPVMRRSTVVQPSHDSETHLIPRNTDTQTQSTTSRARKSTRFGKTTLKTSPITFSTWNINQLKPSSTISPERFHLTNKHSTTLVVSPSAKTSKQFSVSNEMHSVPSKERLKTSNHHYKTQTFNELDFKTSTFSSLQTHQKKEFSQNTEPRTSMVLSTKTLKAENPSKTPQADTDLNTPIKSQSSLALTANSHSASERNSQTKSPIENGMTEAHVTETLTTRNFILLSKTHQNFSNTTSYSNFSSRTLTDMLYHSTSIMKPSSSFIKETTILEKTKASSSTNIVTQTTITAGISGVETSSPVSQTRSVVMTSSSSPVPPFISVVMTSSSSPVSPTRSFSSSSPVPPLISVMMTSSSSPVSPTRSLVVTSSSSTIEMGGGTVLKKHSFVVVFFPIVVFMMAVGVGICIKIKQKKLIFTKVVPVDDHLLSKENASSQVFKIPHSQSQQELLQMDVLSTKAK